MLRSPVSTSREPLSMNGCQRGQQESSRAGDPAVVSSTDRPTSMGRKQKEMACPCVPDPIGCPLSTLVTPPPGLFGAHGTELHPQQHALAPNSCLAKA